MKNLFSFQNYKKILFLQAKPMGVMSTAVGNNIAISWEAVEGAEKYEIYEAVVDCDIAANYQLAGETKGCKMILKRRIPGNTYSYYVRACQYIQYDGIRKKNITAGTERYSKASKTVSTTVAVTGVSTIKNLLRTAFAPMGFTMYVWGGGWNQEDTAAGNAAKRIGVSPAWRRFAKNQNAFYDYKDYRYQIENGLDCSGYVGWCIYNVMHTTDNQLGYVYSASKQAKKFSKLGFGSYRSAQEIIDYKAGDIMSSTCKCCGHVWMVVGQCEDKSVVLVHASPAGVQLSGTTTPQGKLRSQAYWLAKKYMKNYYKKWHEKYPKVSRGVDYLSHYGQMRWRVIGQHVTLSDPDGYQNKNAAEILEDLFEGSCK